MRVTFAAFVSQLLAADPTLVCSCLIDILEAESLTDTKVVAWWERSKEIILWVWQYELTCNVSSYDNMLLSPKNNHCILTEFFFLIVLFLWDSHCYMYGLSKYVWDIHLCFLIALVGSLNVQQDSKRHPSHYIAWVIPVIIYVGLELGSLYSLRTECIPVII